MLLHSFVIQKLCIFDKASFLRVSYGKFIRSSVYENCFTQNNLMNPPVGVCQQSDQWPEVVQHYCKTHGIKLLEKNYLLEKI